MITGRLCSRHENASDENAVTLTVTLILPQLQDYNLIVAFLNNTVYQATSLRESPNNSHQSTMFTQKACDTFTAD
jgi:hypothetical protein